MKFGALLRKRRQKAGKTLGETARHLEVSTPYLSDVERGKRKPLRQDLIERVALFLDADPAELSELALREHHSVSIRSDNPDVMRAAAGLARRADHLSPEQIGKLIEILGGD